MQIFESNSKSLSDDLTRFRGDMDSLSKATEEFGKVFSGTIASAVVKGRGFSSVLEELRTRFLNIALRKSVAPLENALGSLIGSIATGTSDSRLGNTIFSAGEFNRSARSNVPLTHQYSSPVVFNVSAQDASSFRKSETQISALLARTVAKGQKQF